MHYEFNILYYLNTFKKNSKIVMITVGAAVFLTFFISLFAPTVYVSSVTLLDTVGPNAGGSSALLSQFLGQAAMGSSFKIIVPILKSRRMSRDIGEFVKAEGAPDVWWSVSTFDSEGTFAIAVKGPDPVMTEKIANFVVQDLDKINTELDITAAKPMVKVLDAAAYGSAEPKQIPRKLIVAGLLSFIACVIYIFSKDYIMALKHKG